MPYSERLEASRVKLRIETALPVWMKSKILTVDPSLNMPNTLNVEPRRPIDLIDAALPTCMKSRTDNELPNRAIPYTLHELPYFVKCRTLQLLPKLV
jgi:hypothetical protein